MKAREVIDEVLQPNLKQLAMRGIEGDRRILITYESYTPGEFEGDEDVEHGWEDEEGVSVEPDKWDREEGLTAVDKAVEFLDERGAIHASSSHFHPGMWYSTEHQIEDHGTGELKQYSFHLKGFSEDEERAVFRKCQAR